MMQVPVFRQMHPLKNILMISVLPVLAALISSCDSRPIQGPAKPSGLSCDEHMGKKYCFPNEDVFSQNPESQEFGFSFALPVSDPSLVQCNSRLTELESSFYPKPHAGFMMQSIGSYRTQEKAFQDILVSQLGYVPKDVIASLTSSPVCLEDRRSWSTEKEKICLEKRDQIHITSCRFGMALPSCTDTNLKDSLIYTARYEAQCYPIRDVLRTEINRYIAASKR